MFIQALIVFSVTLVSSTILVALILRLSHQNSWYDHTNDRKIHSGDVPRLGGIGFALVFVITATIIIVLTRRLDSVIRFLPYFAGISFIVFFGVWDDFKPIKPRNKLLIQILAALCVVISGFTIKCIACFDFGILESLPWLRYPLTLLWIVGLTNAMNLLDGVDGLAGGISAIIALTFGLIFLQFSEALAAMLCICMLGSIAGFLIFNAPIPKAKIFMGDGGSQFLGFTLALLPLLPLLEGHDTVNLPLSYAAALFIIPILDTTAAVWRRIREKKRIDAPDKAHIHHKLMNLGLSPRSVNAVLLCLQLLLSALVFISLKVDGLLSLGLLGLAYLLALIFFMILHFLNRKANTQLGIEEGFSGNASGDNATG
jgi:UDP-GlcNAc:undecaprenyl-phosphate GlcNAc-1-phosphate transferase